MAKETKKLAGAFAVKDEIEGFLANLEQLKADGSITEEQYVATRQEYYKRLGQATSDIARIKNELQEQLEVSQRDIEARGQELGNLEVRHRVGELSLERYQSSEQKLRAEIKKLERRSEELTALIQAGSAADIGAPARKPKVPPAETGVLAKKPVAAAREPLPPAKAAPPTKAAAPIRSGRLSPGKLLAIIGGAVVVIAIIVAAVLFMTGGVTEVSIPIEVQDAANVGSLHIELVYDGDILNAVTVENGTAVGDALFEYSIDMPGQLVVGLVSSQGMKPDGSIAIVTFQVTGKSKTSTSLSLENVVAHDATTLDEISTSASAGSISTKDGSFTPPTLLFQPWVTE
jgi:hypothetical protein